MDVVEQSGYGMNEYHILPIRLTKLLAISSYSQKNIRGCHFRSDEEVVTAFEEWVNRKDPDFFNSGLKALEHRWSKCIILEGNYIEKEEVDINRK